MKIDVLLPTYNRRAFLPQAIDCIRRQTFRDWRLLVVNDGGEDVADIVAGFGDDRLVYLDRPHAGKAAQLNFALSQVTADYVAYMDDDDAVFPEHLERLLFAAERVNADFVYSDTYLTILDADGKVMSRTVENDADAPYDEIRIFNRVNHKQILHTRDLGRRVGAYDESMRILIDFDFIKRLAGAAKCPFHLREITGEHFLRTDPKTGAYSSISGLWEKDPVAAGRSLLAFFGKDPEALTRLYRSAYDGRSEIARLRRKLGRTFSARWHRLFSRAHASVWLPHDALPPSGEWREVPSARSFATFFHLADETEPRLAAVNAIADGDRSPEARARAYPRSGRPFAVPSPRFAVDAVEDGVRIRHAAGSPRRWVMLTAVERMPEDFALEFDYVPHTEFGEQLQFDFGMSTLGERLRFMVRDNRVLAFNRVADGRFLPDIRRVPCAFPLDEPTHVRIESLAGVISFAADGRRLLSLSGEGKPPSAGLASLVFYEDGASRPVDFEIRHLRYYVPA